MRHHQSDPDHNVLHPLPFIMRTYAKGEMTLSRLPDLFTSIGIVGIVMSESHTPSDSGQTVAFQLLYYMCPGGHDGHRHYPRLSAVHIEEYLVDDHKGLDRGWSELWV